MYCLNWWTKITEHPSYLFVSLKYLSKCLYSCWSISLAILVYLSNQLIHWPSVHELVPSFRCFLIYSLDQHCNITNIPPDTTFRWFKNYLNCRVSQSIPEFAVHSRSFCKTFHHIQSTPYHIELFQPLMQKYARFSNLVSLQEAVKVTYLSIYLRINHFFKLSD